MTHAKLNLAPVVSVLGRASSSGLVAVQMSDELRELMKKYANTVDPEPPKLGRKALRRAFYKAAEKLKVELKEWDKGDD